MCRGDDVYLLDAGCSTMSTPWAAACALARGRLSSRATRAPTASTEPFQHQVIEVPTRTSARPEVEQLDRQRYLARDQGQLPRLGRGVGPGREGQSLRRVQGLPAGRSAATTTASSTCPRTSAVAAGRSSARGASARARATPTCSSATVAGSRAFDELAVPTGLDPSDKRTFPGASELMLAQLGRNYEPAAAAALLGAYARRFVDADRNDGRSRRRLGVHRRRAALLPPARPLQAALDLSYQRRMPRGAQTRATLRCRARGHPDRAHGRSTRRAAGAVRAPAAAPGVPRRPPERRRARRTLPTMPARSQPVESTSSASRPSGGGTRHLRRRT